MTSASSLLSLPPFFSSSLPRPLLLFRCSSDLVGTLTFSNLCFISPARRPGRQKAELWALHAGEGFNGWEYSDLEEEIFQFMQSSRLPDRFPTKEELIEAGRRDLVEGVAKRGGWLAFGWDLGDEGNGELGFSDDGGLEKGGFDEDGDDGDLHFASSSGRELEREEDGGVEGILNRLEKERNFSLRLENEGGLDELFSRDWHIDTQRNRTVASPESDNYMADNFGSVDLNIREHEAENHMNSESDTWKNWGLQRTGFHATNFEAAEIIPTDSDNKLEDHPPNEDILNKGSDNGKELGNIKDNSQSDKKQIRLRLQNLEADLATALQTLRSKANEVSSEKCDEGFHDELNKLADTWEFQENEIMKAQDKLRAIRTKLAVLEGKLTFEIIEAQKVLEEKQRKIHAAQTALSLLRNTTIIWSHSASEVFLAGSFDGWTSQRRMEKSSSDFFILHLKLYPGHYEIKFIVDGVWKLDPMLPIVYNNGNENNLLIIN